MAGIAFVVLALALIVPILWFASEFGESRPLRLVLGMTAILLSFGVAFAVGSLERLNSNAWFGGATEELIDATVSELEAGREEHVVGSLKQLQAQYEPSYENRARYDELVRQTVERMRVAPATQPAP